MRNYSKGKVKHNLNMIDDLKIYLSKEDTNETNSIYIYERYFVSVHIRETQVETTEKLGMVALFMIPE